MTDQEFKDWIASLTEEEKIIVARNMANIGVRLFLGERGVKALHESSPWTQYPNTDKYIKKAP